MGCQTLAVLRFTDIKEAQQPKTFKKGKPLFFNLSLKNKGGGPIQNLVTLLLALPLTPPPTHSPPCPHLPVLLPRNLSAITHLLCLSSSKPKHRFPLTSQLPSMNSLLLDHLASPLSLSAIFIFYYYFQYLFILFGCTKSLVVARKFLVAVCGI